MGRTPCIPPELTRRPFSLDEARNAGLTLSALSGKAWQRVGAELYRWNELPEDPWLTLSAWQHVLSPETVFTGATAAWLLGLDLEPTNPVEVAVPASSGLRSRAGIIVRRCEIPPSEVVYIQKVRATALPLTLAGLCLHRPAVEALIAIDMAVRLCLTDPPLWAITQMRRRVGQEPHGCGRLVCWPLLLNRRWKPDFVGF